MIRLAINLYLLGVLLFFAGFAVMLPQLPVREAAVSALLWPWGVYQHFIA